MRGDPSVVGEAHRDAASGLWLKTASRADRMDTNDPICGALHDRLDRDFGRAFRA